MSYFTPPALLEQLYGRLWSDGRPVCLSVIPEHFDSVFVAYRSAAPTPDENTPPDSFGFGRSHPVGENRALTAMLTDLARSGKAELCLHGHEHRWREFAAAAGPARERLVRALRGFGASFPGMRPRTFVPPYEALSSQALGSLWEQGLDVATCVATARDLGLVADAASAGPMLTRDDGMIVFMCREYVFDPLATDEIVGRAAAEVLSLRPDVLIVANHYWDFFSGFVEPRARRLRIWADFVDDLARDGAEFTTFEREARRRRAAPTGAGVGQDAAPVAAGSAP